MKGLGSEQGRQLLCLLDKEVMSRVCQESTGQGRLDSGGKLVKADKVVFAASLVLESLSLVKRCLSTHDAGRVPFPRVGGLLLPAFWRLETKAGPGVLVPAVFQVT